VQELLVLVATLEPLELFKDLNPKLVLQVVPLILQLAQLLDRSKIFGVR